MISDLIERLASVVGVVACGGTILVVMYLWAILIEVLYQMVKRYRGDE